MTEHIWIDLIPNMALRREVRDMVNKLLMLSEGSAQSFNSGGSRGKVEGSIPKGARFDRLPDQAPSADVSLWEHFSFRFARAAHAGNDIELRRLLILAERAYEDTVKRPDKNRIKIQQERDEQRDIQLLIERGEGIHAAILSVENHWPIGWVRIMRERNGRDPEYGFERPDFKAMSAEEKSAHLSDLREEHGLSQREAATQLGVSLGTVNRYWHGGKVAA